MICARVSLAWFAAVIAFLSAGNAPVHAHGVGIESLAIEELSDLRYRITYKASVDDTEALGLPVLPAHCQWDPAQKRPSGSAGLIFSSREGSLTAEDTILLPWRRNGVVVTALWRNGTKARQFFTSTDEGIEIEMSQLKAGSGSMFRGAKRYTLLGIEHMLTGIDHLFFVAGLLLLVKGVRKLIFAITAFTAAHSVTLALSVLGLVRVSQEYIEAVIALSIVFLAVENVRMRRGEAGLTVRWPWLVSFGFGLFHGLGFAAALNTLGLPTDEIPLALLFFNIGVELGQLAFVVVWFALLWVFRRLLLRLPRPFTLVPAYGLGIMATIWFFERVMIMFA